MKPSDPILRVPAEFLREARRLFGRLRLASGETGAAFPVEVRGGFDGITLAAGDRHCRLETFRPATADGFGSGCILLSRQAFAEACLADPGTRVELAACRRTGGTVLRCRRGGARIVSSHASAGGTPLAAAALPDGDPQRLPARTMELLAMVAPFADWDAPAGPWRSGVCFSPAGGGHLLAGDGRRLACVPARVPPPGFVLPLGAVRVLLHPDFLGYENEVTLGCPGADPAVMFRAWGHLLVAPVLPTGRLENDARLKEDSIMPARQVVLDALRREQLLGWLRALRDARAPVKLEWLAGGLLAVSQGGAGLGNARLELPVGCHGARSPSLLPRLVLPPRDLAAALNLGNRLAVSVTRLGRASLCCHGAGGAFCQVDSLVPAAGSGRAARGCGRRPAA